MKRVHFFKEGESMFNNKRNRVFATVIIIVLILAMIVPTVASLFV